MLEKIKYRLSCCISGNKIRVRCAALMTAVTIIIVSVLGYSINTVEIFDGERTYTVRSIDNNVVSVLSRLELKSDRYLIKSTSVKNRCTTVEIAYAFPVYITVGDNTNEIEFTGGTVAEALNLAGFNPDSNDFVYPELNTVINDTTYIDYTDIEYVDGSFTEFIPYTTETVYSKSEKKGTTKIEDGKEGVKLVSYTEKFVNGVSSQKTVTGETVVEAAVNAKKIIGTKATTVQSTLTSASVKCISTLVPPSPIKLDKNGVPVKYKSKRIARATAYTYTGNNCSTGVAPQPGYIAVNPDIIPYGTKMYIKSSDGRYIYGYAVAADTGGFIKNYPTGVDLFFTTQSACTTFGVRNVEIYILE